MNWWWRNFFDEFRPRRLRMRLFMAFRGAVHGWLNPYSWDFVYPLEALCWRLRHLERCLARDTMHMDADVYAQEIRRFLILIEDWRDPFSRVPRSEIVEMWLHAPFAPRSGKLAFTLAEVAEGYAYIETVRKVEENAWKEAWELYRERARCWWC